MASEIPTNPIPPVPTHSGDQGTAFNNNTSRDTSTQVNGGITQVFQVIHNPTIYVTTVSNAPRDREPSNSPPNNSSPKNRKTQKRPGNGDDPDDDSQINSPSGSGKPNKRQRLSQEIEMVEGHAGDPFQQGALHIDAEPIDSSVLKERLADLSTIRKSSKGLYNCLYELCSRPDHIVYINLNAEPRSVHPPVVDFQLLFKTDETSESRHFRGELWLNAESSVENASRRPGNIIDKCVICACRQATIHESPDDIGYLITRTTQGDPRWIHRLMYPPKMPDNNKDNVSSLGQLIAAGRIVEMHIKDQLKYAILLAEAVLKFDSCWPKGDWNVNDVIYYPFGAELDAERPFLRLKDWSHLQSYGPKLKRRTIYSLGVALIEMFTWKQFEKLREPKGLLEVHTELFKAERKLERKLTPLTFEIIKQCIYADMKDSNGELEDCGAFYRKVVYQLKKMHDKLLEKCSLDPEPGTEPGRQSGEFGT